MYCGKEENGNAWYGACHVLCSEVARKSQAFALASQRNWTSIEDGWHGSTWSDRHNLLYPDDAMSNGDWTHTHKSKFPSSVNSNHQHKPIAPSVFQIFWKGMNDFYRTLARRFVFPSCPCDLFPIYTRRGGVVMVWHVIAGSHCQSAVRSVT